MTQQGGIMITRVFGSAVPGAIMDLFTRPGFDRDDSSVVSSIALSGPGRVNNDLGTRRGLMRAIPTMTADETQEWQRRVESQTLFQNLRGFRPKRAALQRIEQFWATVPVDGDCWEWPGRRLPSGYGRFGSWYAHRYAWESVNGSIPAGMCICHHCDNPPCVRPDHLFLGTAKDNAHDRNLKGRGRKPSRICQRGHDKGGFGKCKECRALSNRRAYVLRKAGR